MSNSDSGSSGIVADSARPAIDDLHEFLAARPQVAADSQEMLRKLSLQNKLTFGGDPFSRYLRPHLITPAQHQVITQVVLRLASAFVKLRRAIMRDEQLMAQLDLTAEERRLVMVDPGFEEPSPSSRLDSFWSEHDWRFVEMNAESPAAIAYSDVLADVFLQLPVLKEWMRDGGYTVKGLYARDRFMEAIEEAWNEFRANRGAANFNERPNIAIVDWHGVPTSTEFEMFKEYFESKGYPTAIADPRELEFRDGRLWAGDFKIDLYYKRVLTSELLSNPDAASATIRAYEEGAICVINSFRAKLLHKKMSFGLLHDDANAHLFTGEELQAIQQHIPWTRKVKEGHTTFNGREIDLVPFILDNRERLVLKPNDEYGGKGVAIGWATADSEWQRALKDALQGSWVVQWAVQLEQEPYPYYDEADGLCFRDLTADLDPYVFGSDTQGIMTRLSAAALLNVTAGTGSVVPTMVVAKSGR